MKRGLLCVLGLMAACRTQSPAEYLLQEAAHLRAGVAVESEEREVRRVLAQRQLTVTTELRGDTFIALGARTVDGKLSAVRVITPRGVVVAEDASTEDLFTPGSIALIERLGPTLGAYTLVAFKRTGRGADVGCVSMIRLLESGAAVRAVLDVSTLGPRACVADLSHAPGGRLAATVAWPGLHAISTPTLEAELAFGRTPLGQPEPLVPVAKLVSDGSWLESERSRLSEPIPAEAPFSTRHALGVARAAIALLSGQSSERQVGSYREAVGRVPPGSFEAEQAADAAAHIERGFSDGALEAVPAEVPDSAPRPPGEATPSDGVVVEPAPPEPELAEGDEVITPAMLPSP